MHEAEEDVKLLPSILGMNLISFRVTLPGHMCVCATSPSQPHRDHLSCPRRTSHSLPFFPPPCSFISYFSCAKPGSCVSVSGEGR